MTRHMALQRSGQSTAMMFAMMEYLASGDGATEVQLGVQLDARESSYFHCGGAGRATLNPCIAKLELVDEIRDSRSKPRCLCCFA